MLVGLGTGSVGTAELARTLGLPHEACFLPWEPARCADFVDRHLPRLRAQGGEVGLYLLPYTELLMAHCPNARFICMQRDQGRVVRGLSRKLGRNPFANPEDGAAFNHAFPFYGAVTLEEGAARFYREFYERAYSLQRRFPDRFRIFFTDHLLGPREVDISERSLKRLTDLVHVCQEDLWAFCGDELAERQETA